MRRRRSWGIPVICALLSIAANYAGLHGVAWWWTPTPVQVPERVTYLDLQRDDDEEEPPEPKAEEEPEPKAETPEPPPEPERLEEPELPELPELEPEPEPDPEPEPEPEPQTPKPPVELVLEQLKMVEQPDEVDEDEAPTDANYLSNVNRDVTEETRARLTNLQTDALQQEAKQLEPSEAPEPGTADENVVAQAREVESRLNRQAPDTRPDVVEQRPEQRDPQKNLLAMRELVPREHQAAAEAHEALAEEADDGTLRGDEQEQASIADQEQRARIDRNDPRYSFKLKEDDLVALFGKDLAAKERAESLRESKTKGVWEDQRARYQSPLENMVPEVQVGNQTALRSRKHPFARYIAQMHRKIHEAWAWGFLEQLDTRGRRHPLNDYDLWTRVEIVINRDGSVDNVMTVRHSGTMSFDAAAREIVWSSGPYPNPPSEIVSGNGKIYIHWAFHRDNKACGTFGAQPFILDNAGQGDRPDPNIRVRPGAGAEQLARRLSPPRPLAPSIPEGPEPPSGDMPHLGHAHGPGGAHDSSRLPGQVPGHAHRAGIPVPPGPAPETLASDPGAVAVANQWLGYLAAGDAGRMAARSTLPFYSGNEPIARTRTELHDVLTTMIGELKGQRPTGAKVYSAAELRRVFGSVPAGIQEGQSRVYALTRVADDYLVLLLERRFGSWRVVGLSR